jgi:hypothetical protein
MRQCQKKIIDFSKMKWAEIEAIQEANHNAVCGMYHPKQIDNWGREVPKNNFNKVAASAALILSLNSIDNVSAQSDSSNTKNKSLYISGVVKSKSKKGAVEAASFVTIFLNGTQYATTSFNDGYYMLSISNFKDTIKEPELVFKAFGFRELRVKLELSKSNFLRLNPILEETFIELGPTMYYVERPTLKNRIKWKLRKWLGKNKYA